MSGIASDDVVWEQHSSFDGSSASRYSGPVAKEGMQPATVVDVVLRTHQTRQPRYWKDPSVPEYHDTVQYVFDTGGAIATSYPETQSVGPKANNRKIVSALYGGEVPDRVRPADLIGKQCMIKVTHKRSVKSDRVFANVAATEIFPLYPGVIVPEPSAPYKRAGAEEEVPF